MKLYVKYDTKPPCLPVAVAESTLELAMMLGMNHHNVQSAISHGYSCWAVIQIDEPETYPDNDGGLWYYDEDGRVVTVEEYE